MYENCEIIFEWDEQASGWEPPVKLWQLLGGKKQFLQIDGHIYQVESSTDLWRLARLIWEYTDVTILKDGSDYIVDCYSFSKGWHGISTILPRPDAECPVCSRPSVDESDEGEAERAFIRKWEACPCCMYDNLDYWEFPPEKEAEAIKDLADLGWD